jgi:membrane protein YqaA with SNARE-associated domain
VPPEQAPHRGTLPAPTEATEPPARIELEVTSPPEQAPDLRSMVLRLLAVLGLFFGAMALLARSQRPALQHLGATFVDRFGLPGLFAGTFAADGFSFPIPPQFYLMTAITSGGPQLMPFLAISAASLAGGLWGYRMASLLVRVPFFRRLLERTQPRVTALFDRFGPLAVVVAGISPLPYSGLCYSAGFYRLDPRLFALFLILRVPRLAIFYAAIRAGWSL